MMFALHVVFLLSFREKVDIADIASGNRFAVLVVDLLSFSLLLLLLLFLLACLFHAELSVLTIRNTAMFPCLLVGFKLPSTDTLAVNKLVRTCVSSVL
jgi:hypothetical protein